MASSFKWESFSDADKTLLRELKATFVMASRGLSGNRLVGLVKENLSKRNVVFGVAEELYIDGFDGQAQFRSLSLDPVLRLAEIIEKAKLPRKFFVLSYPQHEVDNVVRAIRPKNVVAVRGSYLHVFHRRSIYGLLQKRGISFELVSPFTDEAEAKAYLNTIPAVPAEAESGDEAAMFAAVQRIATGSYDYSFQTGAVLAQKHGKKYVFIDSACNEVIPYQTYALHYGNSREDNLSPAHDANHYDTIHAEMNLLVSALKNGRNFEGKTLFINMLPCPSCARTLVKTGLTEVVYHEVHSDGYAVKLFEHAGIKTRKADI